jgi:hypothetical protein
MRSFVPKSDPYDAPSIRILYGISFLQIFFADDLKFGYPAVFHLDDSQLSIAASPKAG